MTNPGPPTALLIDWAGTITVPNLELFLSSATALGLGREQLESAGEVMKDYLHGEDSILHRAEVGAADDDDLLDYLSEEVPGMEGLFDASGPSIFQGANRPEVIELLEDLTDRGVFVLISTNNFASAQDILARRYLESGLAHGVANSALMGVRKPDPVFYEMCLDAAGVEPGQAVFVDDQPKNVEAAAALGIRTVLMGDDSTAAIAELRQIFALD